MVLVTIYHLFKYLTFLVYSKFAPFDSVLSAWSDEHTYKRNNAFCLIILVLINAHCKQLGAIVIKQCGKPRSVYHEYN